MADALARYPSAQPQRDADEEAEDEEIPLLMELDLRVDHGWTSSRYWKIVSGQKRRRMTL